MAAQAGRFPGFRRAPSQAGRPDLYFPDFRRAPNQAGRPDLYELENRAADPDRLVLAAMRRLAPWRGKVLADLGCGSGYWLAGYAAEAATVIGIEPDPDLLRLARGRGAAATVLPGSAEHLPLADASVDVVHARFAYFWPPGCGPGLAEVLRVLKPGGTLVVVDNDQRSGEFAALLREAANPALGRADVTDAWWARRGAERVTVASRWQFTARADFEAVLGLEFPARVAGPWLARHPRALG
ncbi:MAG: class I SAM-dependent methyltransferase, partial [Actinobacteria bacterium]|nr:class I SAM-dependent methyltransferase [Actinomycetota bacterium]